MIGRIENWIRTLIRRELDAESTSRRDAEKRQVRELIHEMEDVLEKFARVVAREAKRRARDMKATLHDEETPDAEPAAAAAAAGGVDLSTLPLKERKALLRQRLLTRATGQRRVAE